MRRPKEPTLIRRRPGSPFWQFDIPTPGGRRLRGSAETDSESEALAKARAIWAREWASSAPHKTIERRDELTLSQALGKYWLLKGQFTKSADDIKRMGRVLMHGPDKQTPGLGPDTPLCEIDSLALMTYAARRRATVSNRSVNCELEHLRAVINLAKTWKVAVPEEIVWKGKGGVLLDEVGERQHIMSQDEEQRFFAALRPDFHPLFRFAMRSGQRLDNCISLTWAQIKWDLSIIELRIGKKKSPEGALHYVPLTNELKAMLAPLRGHHPERVFTYACERNRHDPKRGVLQHKGERYPYTKHGWRKAFAEALAAAGIEDFRFHDLRHTALTRIARRSNVQVAKRLAGHSDIKTTLRYVKTDLDDVAAALNQVAASDCDSLTVTQTGTE